MTPLELFYALVQIANALEHVAAQLGEGAHAEALLALVTQVDEVIDATIDAFLHQGREAETPARGGRARR